MSSEDFKSLILTNPDLVDESIDVSGLRTQTDTNPRLLGAIEGYPGIEYDPTSYSYLSDLNRLFASGLPEIDTSQPATPPSNEEGGGGGGGGGTTPTQPDSIGGFDPGVTPGPSGFIGLDPEYDVSPFEFDDYQTYEPPTPPSGITSDPIEMENIMTYENPYQEPMDFDNPGASIENILQPNTPGTIGGAVDVFDINQTGDPSQNPGSTNVGNQFVDIGVEGEDPDRFNSISTIANPDIFDSYAGVNDPQIGDPGFTGYTPSFDTPEQENTVQNIFGKVGQTVEGALTELGKIPGAIVDFGKQTVDVFGKKLNVGKTLAGLAINKIAGGPVSLVFDIAKEFIPEQDPRVKKLDDFYSTGEGSKYMDPNSANYIPGMDQYNTVSGGLLNTITQGKYGTPTNYGLQGAYQKRIDTIEKTLADKYNMTDADIADIKAGTYTNEEDIETDLIQRLVDLQNAKKEEADMLGITAAEEKGQKELEFKDFFAGNKDQDSVDKFDTTPTTTPFDANTFDDDVTLTGTPPPGMNKVTFGSEDPSYYITPLEDDFKSLVDTIPTSTGPIYNETTGNYEDADGNIIDDPNVVQELLDEVTGADYKIGIADKTTKAGLDSGFNPFTGDELTDDQKEEIQKGNYQKVIDELTGITPKKTSLKTIDTSDDKPQGPGPSGFVGLDEDMDVDPFEFDDMSYEPPSPPKDTGGDSGGQGGGADMGTAPKGGTYDAEAEDDQYEAPAPTPTEDFYRDPITTGGGGNQGDPGCFIKGTLITMADKTTKPVEQVDLEDEVAVGGKVFAVGRFLNTELYDYKGIKVSGSHMVNEEGVWMRVRDTKHGKSLGDDKHTVYVFGSENRRILINGILFTDYFEVKDQEQLLKKENKFFDDWKTFANNEDQKNVDTLNAV